MTTWISVNLPLFPSKAREFHHPESMYTTIVLSCGTTWREACDAHSKKTKEILAREGKNLRDHNFYDLSEGARAEINTSNAKLNELFEELNTFPEMKELVARNKQLWEEYEASYFGNKMAVGMLLEFEDGQRLLVGDILKDGSMEGGEGSETRIVTRFTMIQIPE